MKGKYSKKKQKNTGYRWILITVILLVLGIGGLWIAASLGGEDAPVQPPETTQAPETAQVPVTTLAPGTTAPQASVAEGEPFQPINLGYGVHLERVGSYTGTYMEDGSDQMVSGVMMIRVTNTGEDDIQLMNIQVAYTDKVYNFMLTNLPAGGTAVLLELDRAPMPEGTPISATVDNVTLFSEPMEADLSVYEISGQDGALNVKNISGADIGGNVYVYYKYKIQDVYYGGITFRVTIEGGLASGELRQIMTSHYNPDNCEIVMVEAVQNNGN